MMGLGTKIGVSMCTIELKIFRYDKVNNTSNKISNKSKGAVLILTNPQKLHVCLMFYKC